MSLLETTIANIRPVNREVQKESMEYIDGLIKPIGSLGKLEKIAAQIAGITGKVKDNDISRRCIIAMCADNGIHEEGVTVAPTSVTTLMAIAMAAGKSGMTVMAKQANADYILVDVGIKDCEDLDGVVNRKIAHGTKNSTKGPAMTREECIRAIETGIEITKQKISEGYKIIGTGELGMGNTSTSSCITSVLLGIPVETTVGKGAGITDEMYRQKTDALKRALEINAPDRNDPIDVVAKVGGFDIAGLIGVYLACAEERVPVIIDGFISATAALAASRLSADAVGFMIPSHVSEEPAFKTIMTSMGLDAYLALDMRLGEGSGCPIAFHVIDCALAMENCMATFAEATIDNSEFVDIREDE